MKRYLMPGVGFVLASALLMTVGGRHDVSAHCQVPCGIYDDHARLHAMLEDVATITKAMTQIKELAGKMDAESLNQATRWINTKETHASSTMAIVAEYFLAQRVQEVETGGSGYPVYLEKLAAHHRVLRAAMKTKQTVDTAAADKLKAAVETMSKLYPE